MNEHDAQYQAEKLWSFVRRGGSGRQWWDSKSFTRREENEILQAYAKLAEDRTRRGVVA